MTNILELLKHEKVEWKKLGEVVEILDSKRKPIKKSDRILGNYPYYGANGIQDYVNDYIFDGTFILMGEDGSVMNKNFTPILHWIEMKKIWVNNHAHVLGSSSDCYNLKYIYYYLSTINVSGIVKGMPPKINQANMRDLEIPIPSLETQKKIVDIFDKFTNYVTALQSELQSRTKQYEYYRDMLLSEEYLNKITKEMEEDKRLNIVRLGEIGKFTRGNGLQKKDFQEEGNPVIHYGQIYTQYGFSTDKVLSYVSDEIFSKLRKAQKNDILIATTSENIEDVGKSVVWLGDEEIGFSGDMYSYRTKQNPKFIAYFFQTNNFQKQKERRVTGTKMIRIHSDDMENFEIYLPSLSLQNKIVKILDKFQVMLADTKGLLPEEIEQRQKQYEYYREKLLTFDKYCDSTHSRTHARTLILSNHYYEILQEVSKIVEVEINDAVCVKLLGEIGKISMCKRILKTQTSEIGEIPFYKIGTFGKVADAYITRNLFNEYKEKYSYPKKGEILISASGTIGRTIIFNGENSYYQDSNIVWLSHNENEILNNYLYYYYQVVDWNPASGGTIKRLYNYNLMNIRVSLPPLHVQQHIVSILDKFDTLVHDIKEGLPKEIELRQKQYEYWREQLLSFNR